MMLCTTLCAWVNIIHFIYLGDYRPIYVRANTFKNEHLLKSRHCSVIWPSIVLMGGLPGANKSVILQKLLTRYVRQADGSAMTIDKSASSKDMKVYEIVAIGNKHLMLFWSEVTKLNCHNFCIASAILHDCELDKAVLHLNKDFMRGIFRNVILDEHFQTVYAELNQARVSKTYSRYRGTRRRIHAQQIFGTDFCQVVYR